MAYGQTEDFNAVSDELTAIKKGTKWYGIRPVSASAGLRCMAAYSTREEAEIRARYQSVEYQVLGPYEVIELVELPA